MKASRAQFFFRLSIFVILPYLVMLLSCQEQGTQTSVTSNGEYSVSELSALDKMSLAFDGNPSSAAIKDLIDPVLRMYGLAPNENNYNRAGSVLVRMRQEYGVSETDILEGLGDERIPYVNLPEAIAITTVLLIPD